MTLERLLTPVHGSEQLLREALRRWQLDHPREARYSRDQLVLPLPDFETAPHSALPSALEETLATTSARTMGGQLEAWHQRALPVRERKRRGQFATPPMLVNEVLSEAFGALGTVGHGPLRVLEPAAGFGAFAGALLEECGLRGLSCELTTIDADPTARPVVDAIAALAAAEHPAIALSHAHLEGDFLAEGLGLRDGSFDLVIGNPPYIAAYARGAHRLDPLERSLLKARYRFASGRINTAVLFLERSLSLLREGGICAFVLPSAIFHMATWTALREWLLEHHHLHLIRYCGEGAFDASVPVGVLVVERGPRTEAPTLFGSPALREVRVVRDGHPEVSTPAARFRQFPHVLFSPHIDSESLQFIAQMERDSVPLGSLVEIRDGINPGNLADLLVGPEATTPEHRKVLRGGDITPFHVAWSGSWVRYDPRAIEAASADGGYAFLREERIFRAPIKLVHRQTANRLIAALDSSQHYVLNSVHCSIPHDPADAWFLLALYNSELLTRYYRQVFCETEASFPQVKTVNLRKLPIRRFEPALEAEIADLARQAAASPLEPQTVELRERIERLVERGYGVSAPPGPP